MNRTRDRDVDNVRVVVRCRGRNQREMLANAKIIIEPIGDNQIRIASRGDAPAKVYSVDRVFGSLADQHTLFTESVKPLVNDFLAGLSCTVLAYGQTGTGKTYTISGDCSDPKNAHAGIIPRVLATVFEHLQNQKKDYSLSCQYVELYNEELRDLLIESETPRPLRLLDDPTRKAVKISGAEEVFITSTESALKVISLANTRRKAAATKLNAQSSRSHAVFTLKLAVMSKAEQVTCSKLHLVDLAGSENIGRSGAEKSRAREAGSINQSLLVLGRVISSLVDRASRVPYRDSKLTRILQDSLGGSTKTCLVATLSPVIDDCEESVSTLEYASRAKSIKNHPQILPSLPKPLLLQELVRANEVLRSELADQRDHDGGVFMTSAKYTQWIAEKEMLEQKLSEADGRQALQKSEVSRLDSLWRAATEQVVSVKAALAAANERAQDLEVQNSTLHRHVSELSSERNHLHEQVSSLTDRLKQFDKTKASQQKQLSEFRDQIMAALEDLQSAISAAETSATSQQNHLLSELVHVASQCREGLDALTPVEPIPFDSGADFKHRCRVEVARGIETIEHAIGAAVQKSHTKTTNLFAAARLPLQRALGFTQELRCAFEADEIAARAASQLAADSQDFFQKYEEHLSSLKEAENRRREQSEQAEAKIVDCIRAVFSQQRERDESLSPGPSALEIKKKIGMIANKIESTSTAPELLVQLDRALASSNYHLQRPPQHSAELPDGTALVKSMSTSIEEAIDGFERQTSESIRSFQTRFAQQVETAQAQFGSANERMARLVTDASGWQACHDKLHDSVAQLQRKAQESPSRDIENSIDDIGRGVTLRMHNVDGPAPALQEIVNDESGAPRKRRTISQHSPGTRRKAKRNIY